MKKTLIAPILLLIALVAGALLKLCQVRNTAGPLPNGPSSNGASRRCDHHCRGVLRLAWPCPHLAGGRTPRYCIDLCNR